ncbi:MAG: LEA type 2 family protein [Desulfobacterales bacterium]|jgi:LEA14-like dessication related protein
MKLPHHRLQPTALLVALTTLITWGCAVMPPAMEAPRISLVNITSQPSEGMETIFQLELRLINPNDVPINLKGIDCRLEINDSTIASGVSNAPAELPALGTIVYPVTAYASASDFIMLMVRLMTANRSRSPEDFELIYGLRGRIFLADGVPGLNRLSFESEGDLLKLIQPPEQSSP